MCADSQNSRKLCTADKSWKSLDAGSLAKIYDKDVSGQCLSSADLESHPSSEACTLPPPAKFSNSRRKLLEMEIHDVGVSLPSMSPTACSTDTVFNFSFTNCSNIPVLLDDLSCLVDIAPQPTSPQKAVRRNHRRKMNFSLGLQNEAERQRQRRRGW
jgi:hypothetical protein